MREIKPLLMAISVVVLAALVGMISMTKHHELDLWWHLKLGELVATNRAIPFQDSFSYTFAGQRQFTGEWLADLLFYGVFQSAGFLGLNLLKAAAISLTLLFTAMTIRLRLQGKAEYLPTVIITLLVVLFAIRFRLFVRPYIFSICFSAVFLFLLEQWRQLRQGKTLLLLPPLMLLWTNLSVGAVFGVIMVTLAALVGYFEERDRKLPLVAAATLLASLLNPEGIRLYSLAASLTSDPYRALVPEYRPLTAELLWGNDFLQLVPFQLLVLGSLLYLLALRGWKNLFHTGLFVFFLYETFRQLRLIEIFSIVAAPFFAAALASALGRAGALLGRQAHLIPLGAVTLALLTIPLTYTFKANYLYGYGLKSGVFPEGALRFLNEQRIGGRMFNSYAFGGYLIWQAPERPVFIDGRYRRVYPAVFAGEYLAALTSAEGWQTAERKYGFDYAVISYDLLQPKFPEHLAANSDWVTVYWDNNAVVAVRRTPQREELISRFAYRVSRPATTDFSYLDRYVSEGRIDEACDQLEREIALNRDNQVPFLAALYLLHQAGSPDYPRMLRLFEQLLPLQPDFAMKHTGYAQLLLETGQITKAKQELAKALALDPYDQVALSLQAQIANSAR